MSDEMLACLLRRAFCFRDMAIPNTTPTPNELYNGEMKKMGDTELRVVLIVTRATLGWVIDKETGMRKTEDWIAHKQLVEKSGRKSKAISRAVGNCVKNGWIETRTEEGKLLKTAQERKLHGRKIYYRLGKVFLRKVNTIVKKTMDNKPSSLKSQTIVFNDLQPSSKGRTTKETLTKEIIQKKKTSFKKKRKPYYEGMEMRLKGGKWWCIPTDGGEWLEFAGKKKDINWV